LADPDKIDELRFHTHTARPLGDEPFLDLAEALTGRVLQRQKRGPSLGDKVCVPRIYKTVTIAFVRAQRPSSPAALERSGKAVRWSALLAASRTIVPGVLNSVIKVAWNTPWYFTHLNPRQLRRALPLGLRSLLVHQSDGQIPVASAARPLSLLLAAAQRRA